MERLTYKDCLEAFKAVKRFENTDAYKKIKAYEKEREKRKPLPDNAVIIIEGAPENKESEETEQ